MSVFCCGNCMKKFDQKKGLSLHLSHNVKCKQSYIFPLANSATFAPQQSFKKQRVSHALDEDVPFNKEVEHDNTNYTIEDSEITEQSPTFVYCNNTKVEIELLKLLQKIGAPHYAFKLIMDWAFNAFVSGYKFSPQCNNYQHQINKLNHG